MPALLGCLGFLLVLAEVNIVVFKATKGGKPELAPKVLKRPADGDGDVLLKHEVHLHDLTRIRSMTISGPKHLKRSPARLVSFYRGQCSNSSGRTIDDIHAWNYDQLEYVHDYIQWLFPLTERSQFNPEAPLLDAAQIQIFRSDEKLQQQLAKSFKVMLSFYGFHCAEKKGKVVITKSKDYAERSQNWLSGHNHNYLRITRILSCLRLLGLENYARALFICLQQIFREDQDKIGDITFGYWQRAVS